MAQGESILPCQLVGVEMRWLTFMDDTSGSVMLALGRGTNPTMAPARLQYRRRVRDDHGRAEWSQWVDVPIATERAQQGEVEHHQV